MFIIEVPYINLDAIYDSKQVPLWTKLRNSKYIIVDEDTAVKVEQQKTRLMFSCSEKEFYSIWYNYFDLSNDYFKINRGLKSSSEDLIAICNKSKGIHIIHQDKWPLLVFSELVRAYGYNKATKALNHIKETCGTKHVNTFGEGVKVVWYEFPEPEQILSNIHNLKRMGKVNQWLKDFCEFVIKNPCLPGYANKLYQLIALNDLNVFPGNELETFVFSYFRCGKKQFIEKYLKGLENKGLLYLYMIYFKDNQPKDKWEAKLYESD